MKIRFRRSKIFESDVKLTKKMQEVYDEILEINEWFASARGKSTSHAVMTEATSKHLRRETLKAHLADYCSTKLGEEFTLINIIFKARVPDTTDPPGGG